jgi:hypothetical protein
MGSLLVAFGDVLLSQGLAQPGMLVVHLSLLLLHRSLLLAGAGHGRPLTGPFAGRPAG